MLPGDLVDVSKRLQKAIKKHRVGALGPKIIKAAQPQVALFQTTENLMEAPIGDIHERARKVDPSIPERFNAAMKSPGLDAMMKLLRAQAPAQKPGASRLAGTPDLPADLPWPKHKDKCLPFVAQIDLAALPRWEGNPLPKSGWIWAFAGGDVPPVAAISYWDGDRALLKSHPTPPADKMLLESLTKPEYAPVALDQAEVVVHVPGYGSEWWNDNMDADDDELTESMIELLEELQRPAAREEGANAFMLGDLAGEDTATELAVKYGKKKGKDWVPLLHVVSAGTMTDTGAIAFLVRAADLGKGDFSNVYATVLSS
jgi:uncharacterized protein YwqG